MSISNLPGLMGDNIRELEEASIVAFLKRASVHFHHASVLDFGCGSPETCRKPQPYKDLVEMAGGTYFGYDPGLGHSPDAWLGAMMYDTILCTQVIQAIKRPWETLQRLAYATKPRGFLIMTYPMMWPWSPDEPDYWRFTPAGMRIILNATGWDEVHSEERGRIDIPGWPISLGHGVIAQKREVL